MKKNGVSIVLCCYNSTDRLAPTLNHLFGQYIPEHLSWEIIVVDNNSTDDTSKFAHQLFENTDKSISFRVVKESKPGLMNARKRGIASCIYDLMLFVDDDNWLDKFYVSICYELFDRNDSVGIVGGIGTVVTPNVPWWFTQYEESFALGPQGSEDGNVQFVYGAGMCINKEAWQKLESAGFKSMLLGRTGKALTSGEDTEICLAVRLAGYQILYDHRLKFKHDLPVQRLNWAHLRKLYFNFGEAKAKMDIYTAAISEKPMPKSGRLPFWFNRIYFLSTQVLSDIPTLICGMFRPMEGNDRLLKATAKLGHIAGIWNARRELPSLYEQVYRLKDAFN